MRPQAENQKKGTVIVTGSSGFIGAQVVRRLAHHFRIIGFDRPGAPHPPPEADCVDVDLSDETSVQAAFKEVRQKYGEHLSSVIHLAAYYDFSGEPSDKYEKITIHGTENVLRALKDFKVDQFLFSSTMLVHAPTEPGKKIREDSPINPKWDYPKSKAETEKRIRAMHGDIPIVLLRIAGVYEETGHSIPLANQIQRIYERWLTSHLYPGDVSRGQSFLHIEDLVDAIELAVQKKSELPRETVLLLGEETTLSYDELQRTLGRLIHDETWETRQIPKVVAKTGAWIQDNLPFGEEPFIKPFMVDLADDHYELDIGQARKLLGWHPKHSVAVALPKMVAALKADPQGWYEANGLKSSRNMEAATV